MRKDGRAADQLRPVKITRGFTQAPAGSVLWEQGRTILLCTASVTPAVPAWFGEKRVGGWVTAEYVMLPGSSPRRKEWPRMGHTDSRGTEIQRLIGRSIRAVVDLEKIGPHTIVIDCQVLQADGGTRTAAICGAYVALADAMRKLPAELPEPRGDAPARDSELLNREMSAYDPGGALCERLAAVSVGVVDGELRLDLDYEDDVRAEVDLNVALTGAGRYVEVQGTAEHGQGFDRDTLNAMLDLAAGGCEELMKLQRAALSGGIGG